MRPKRILVLGGGPGGLYAAALLKKTDSTRDITVIERNPSDATFGFGIVFSDATLRELHDADPKTHQEITESFAKWDAIDVRWNGEIVRSHGHAFAGISRKAMLLILQKRCAELGVTLTFNTEFSDFSKFSNYDLVVAADGGNSCVRKAYSEFFQPIYDVTPRKYVWLGTNMRPDSMFFSFRETDCGLFLATVYPFTDDLSTFIVECDPDDWERAGLQEATEEDTASFAKKIFAEDLKDRLVVMNKSQWINFVTIKNKTWHHGNIVLLGDAAHTAHYSVGSGTRMAMEDAIALTDAINEHEDLEEAFVYYERGREPFVEAVQEAAATSYKWFTSLSRYKRMDPTQFAFNLVTRSGRIGYDNLRVRDPKFIERVDRWFVGRTVKSDAEPIVAPPPMFTPLKLRNMIVQNRVLLSPIGNFSANGGTPNDTHLTELKSLAEGGAGLVMTEVTAVSPNGRITPRDVGMYCKEHAAAWARIVASIHEHTTAKITIRLSHAGRRGSTRPRWEGLDRPLLSGNWPLISASPLAYAPESQVPSEMDRGDMDQVREQFVQATKMSLEAGFDMLQLQFAHGYLLASFLSPLINRRTDEYGGSLENRLRFPLEVFDAVRALWPEEKPICCSISGSDWARGGIKHQDVLHIARVLKRNGCDIIEVLAGQTVIHGKSSYGRYFLSDLSDAVRNKADVCTMTRGRITTSDEANTIIAGGRADLCVMDPVRRV